jgi:signal transduction histidine kinase
VSLSSFDSLKHYVGFTDESSSLLRALRPIARPHFVSIVDDFYAAIEADPKARAVISGGTPQVERLKQTLIQWLDSMLLGPHDQAYYERRARIGRVHVRIGLPQAFMFTAMNRIRVRLGDVLQQGLADDPPTLRTTTAALHQILDLELAIMLETYREDLELKSRAAERLATIGQFSAGIAHELRNPLAVIESSLFLVRRHLEPAAASMPGVAKHLDRIGGEVARATKTIDNLLDLARRQPPLRQRTELRGLIESAVQATPLPATVHIKVTATPSDVTAEVDPDQIRQVLINLFANSAQAMPHGGQVEVVADRLVPSAARLRVRDDGPGITEGTRHRLFEALFTTKAKGSGLGLALCRRIMEAHGGTIDLESTDSGTSFVLVLPDAQGARGAVA